MKSVNLQGHKCQEADGIEFATVQLHNQNSLGIWEPQRAKRKRLNGLPYGLAGVMGKEIRT